MFQTPQDGTNRGFLESVVYGRRPCTSSTAEEPAFRRLHHVTQKELAALADAWREWAAADDGWFAMLHGELICER